jgi:GrpB-like predicted nucleotidyltransferase (UPF0157 family)
VTGLFIPYDPEWPEQFEEEADALREALGPVVIEVEHIGSTAVPGLPAKPTVDIAVGVGALDDVDDEKIAAMEELDYVFRGEAGVPGRRYFRKGEAYPRDFHVSIVEWGGTLWNDYLLLRDYLRSHPHEGAAYVDAKRAAEQIVGTDDPIAYWEHKREFVESLLERARDQA